MAYDRRAMARFRAVLFDLDGTLADTKDDIATAVNLTMADLGLPAVAPTTIYGFIGHGVRQLLLRALGEDDPERLRRAHAIFDGYYRRHLLDTTRFYPGVSDLLDTLRHRGQRMAIVTNKPMAYTTALILGLKADRYFDVVLGSEGGEMLKPHPGMLQKALAAIETAPAEALMVGDGVPDIQAARAAGLQVCAVGYGLGDADELRRAEPDFFCETITDLRRLFGKGP